MQEHSVLGNDQMILVLEDNPVFSNVIVHVLEQFPIGYHVVRNGKQAVQAAADKAYDLILVDILLSEADGVQAIMEIRQLSDHNAHVPVVGVTPDFGGNGAGNYQGSGLTGVVKLPVTINNLSNILQNHLGPLGSGRLSPQQANLEPETNVRPIVPGGKAASGELSATLKPGSGVEGPTVHSVMNWAALQKTEAVLEDDFQPELADYLKNGPDVVRAMADAIEADDFKKIEKLAHKFRTTSLVFGAESVADLSAQLEAMGSDGSVAKVGETLKELRLQLARVLRKLREKTAR